MGNSKGFSKWYILLAVVLVIVAGYWLFANMIIKQVLESKLSEAYGAEVDIGEFDHTLFPVTVQMRDIGLTNPSKPSHNQVLVGTASADVELQPLLSDRVIVNQLSLLEVKFDQPRPSPGEVYRQPQHAFSFNELKALSQDAVPTVDELLARSTLKTTAAVEQAQQAYSTYSDQITERYKNLPDKERLAHYKEQISQLKAADYKDPQALLSAREDLERLKQQIGKDREKISQFTADARQATETLSSTVTMLKQAPQQDYNLLKGAITGDQAALQQVTEMVFGDKAAQLNEYLMAAIQIVLPLIQGDEEPKETASSIPSVLVRQADVSVNVKNERITSVWKNITNTHAIVGEPTTFTIAAVGDIFKQFESSGEFWIDVEGVDASQSWTLAGINLSNIPLARDERFSALLKQALLATSGSLNVQNSSLTGSGKINLNQLQMDASGDSKITQAIATALNSLSQLSMDMSLGGSIQDPQFSISSDLDNQLAQSAVTQLTASQQDKLDELNRKLNSMVNEQQNAVTEQLVDVQRMLELAQGDSAALEDLLQTQLNNVVDKQKQKLLDKLKGKLGQGS